MTRYTKVVKARPDRWYVAVINQTIRGYTFRYVLELECGHEVSWASDTYPSRDINVPPAAPYWVKCLECDER